MHVDGRPKCLQCEEPLTIQNQDICIYHPGMCCSCADKAGFDLTHGQPDVTVNDRQIRQDYLRR